MSTPRSRAATPGRWGLGRARPSGGVAFARALGLAALVLLLAGRSGAAQDGAPSSVDSVKSRRSSDGPFFYRDLGYGSEAYYGPLAVLLNKGFAVSLVEGSRKDLAGFPYGIASVADALTRPGAAIERAGGWGKFVREELLPLTWGLDEWQWYPNYTGHLIEGGIHSRQLQEWYEARGVPLAGVLARATTIAASVFNEAYETAGNVGSAQTVADLYVFDVAGIVLFSFDGVARFFADKLHTSLWTGQASFVFPVAETANNSSHLFFKIPWGVVPQSSIFLWTGIGAGGGLTLHRDNGLDVSFGLGPDADKRIVDPVTGDERVVLTAGGGIWVDRNGSLLASAQLSEVRDRLLRVNVYPGVLPGIGRELGAWLILAHGGKLRFGLSTRHALGLGLGFGRSR